MQRARKWTSIIIISSCMFIVTGCLEQKQLEKLGLITAVGYDIEKEDRLRGTVAIHQFDPMAQNVTKRISAVANTAKGLRQAQNLESNQKLVTGQLRCVIYSKELAEKGILQLVDSLNRDNTVGNLVYLTVAEGPAEQIMKLDKTNSKISLGTYLYNLIKQNVESEQIISPTLHDFNHSYFDSGKDPVLPIIKIEKQNVIISGMALFRNDQYIKTLEPEKHFYLKLLSDKYKAGTHEIGFNPEDFDKIRKKDEGTSTRNVYDKLYINIDNIHSHTKIKLVNKQNLHFKVVVEMDSRLLETTEPLDLSKPANIKFIEKKVDKAMEKDMKELIKDLQKLNVDPIGFGNEYKTHLRRKNLTRKGWKELYKNATFDVKVNNTIIKTGIIE